MGDTEGWANKLDEAENGNDGIKAFESRRNGMDVTYEE
jgi:hypothetical protein